MKQAQYTIQDTMRNIDKFSVLLFWTLLAGLVVASCSYGYFINKTVRNVVLRDTLQTEIASLNSKLSETEFQYISSVGSIGLDTAYTMGFKQVTDKTFVTRESLGRNVALR